MFVEMHNGHDENRFFPGYGGEKLRLRRLKEIDGHFFFRLSILSKTLLAEVAFIFC